MTALNAGLRQSGTVRTNLACNLTHARPLMISVMGYAFQGQGHYCARINSDEGCAISKFPSSQRFQRRCSNVRCVHAEMIAQRGAGVAATKAVSA